ncbi:heparinase II/III family protein [Rufibacter sp. XAAS-G3-1]|uniref:heparinase II/III domain-containing protein n=1 Tax=Rufibacter sp. XAAS-G3-1 TaxID=2729134 RepID=UPI0015E762CC|nr:heparinase II/III family protein [Rufibacter sp. XAAS-G3-1]
MIGNISSYKSERQRPAGVSILVLLALWLAVHAQGVAQVVSAPKARQMPSHPRLLLLKGGEKAIQNTIKADKAWKKVHESILEESAAMIGKKPLRRELTGIRLLSVSREGIKRILFLSYAYRLTQEEKYLKRAETELLALANFPDWNPGHFLDVAEMTLAVAIGYDWLHHHLSPQTKASVKNALLTKGLEPSLKPGNNSWLQRSSNWNQVCNAGMVFGALAVYEDQPDLAEKIIQRAVKSLPLAMQSYAPSGAYPEGYSYWGYGTTFNVLLIDALEKAYGTDFQLSALPGFLSTGDFLQHMVGPTGKSFNFSDGTESTELSPAMFWLAKRQNNLSLLFTEKQYLESGVSLTKNRMLPLAMVWGAGATTRKVQEPKEFIWVGHGVMPVALMRSSWTDKNAIYVGFKGGSPSASHAQMDVGSFVMDANNERWAMDLGMQDYTSLEAKGVALWDYKQNGQRWKVLRHNNLFHNTLAVNNSLQQVKGFAPIVQYSDKPSFLSAVTNLTEIYKDSVSSASRGVAILEGKYVVVRDEIATGQKKTKIRWSMVTPAQVKILADGTAELTQNGKKLTLTAFGPAKINFKTWSTAPIQDYDAANPGTVVVGFETDLPPSATSALTVLLVPENASISAGIEQLALKNWPIK